MKCYRIKNWDTHYENNRSRKIDNTIWVPIPNDLSSYGYRLMMNKPEMEGAALFGCFIAVIELASKCKRRGTLVNDHGIPYTAESISIKTGMMAGLVQNMLDVCVNECIWMEFVDSDQISTVPPTPNAEVPQVDAPMPRGGVEGKGIEGKGIEGNTDTSEPAPPDPDSKRFDVESFQYLFANKLYECLVEPNGGKRPDMQKWAANVDKMLRIDKRTVRYLEDTLLAVLGHNGSGDFRWSKVIKSAEKFRKQMNKGNINPKINEEVKRGQEHRQAKAAREHEESLQL